MRVLLVNPPYQTLTSNLGVGHQTPLGLLMVGGALRDAGHAVRLLDAEAMHLTCEAAAREAAAWRADVVMVGHAGSTPAHDTCVRLFKAVQRHIPQAVTVYGGVYPSYHAATVLRHAPAIDVVVRGEGEATAVALCDALAATHATDALALVPGIAFRDGEAVIETPESEPIANLDAYRVGWELIDNWDRYQCFGLGRAAVMQFSRGCPHRCTYCG